MLRRHLPALCIVLSFCLRAQNQPGDSTVKSVDLKEVCIYETADPNSEAFNFYKSSKLANTEDILSRMEGVNLIKRGAYGLEPSIRNYGSGQTNVTIDGMRIYGACTDKMDPVSIYVEPVNLQSIQLAHGASGALNGSTIGGQINFQLKEPEFICNRKLHGQISQSYASVNDGLNTTASLQQSLGRISYRISGALRDAGNYTAGGGKTIQNSGYHKSNLSSAFAFKIDSNQTLKVNYLGDWGRNIGYPALSMDVGEANAQIFSLSHAWQLNKKYFRHNEAKVYYNDIYHAMDDTHRSDAAMHMDMPGWSKTFGAYDNLTGSKGTSLRLDYHHTSTRADMVMYPSDEPLMYLQTLPENTLSDLGLAMQQEIKFNNQQQIAINGRLDYYNQYAENGPGVKQWEIFNKDIRVQKTDLLKNLNLQYGKTFREKLLAQLSLGYGERIPTSNERYGYYLFNRQDQYDYMGNPDLKPEKSLQSEFRLRYLHKKIECSVNFFLHHTNDYIYSYQLTGYGAMTIGANGLKTYTNIAYAVSRGTELMLKYRLTDRFTYVGTGKYVYASTNTGLPLPLVPPLKLQQAIRFHSGLFQAQVEYDCATAQKRVNPDYGDKVTPGFNLFNIRASKNFRTKFAIIQAAAACENIFDLNYHEHLDIGQVPRFGRSFSVNLSILF